MNYYCINDLNSTASNHRDYTEYSNHEQKSLKYKYWITIWINIELMI